jgi:predicted nucleic acid-binding protein
MKLFLDTNILLDILLHRKPFYAASAQVFRLIEIGIYTGMTTPISLTTIEYVATKQHGRIITTSLIKQLCDVLAIASVDAAVVQAALDSPFDDFEDAVQYVAALNAGCTHIITRNTSDFAASQLPVLPPAVFLEMYAPSER